MRRLPLILAAALAATPLAAQQILIGTPAEQGPVDGVDQMSDEFIWRSLTEFAAP